MDLECILFMEQGEQQHRWLAEAGAPSSLQLPEYNESNTPLFQRLHLDRPKLSRNRGVHACQQCRSRKVKCDQSRPRCQNCATHNRACIYESRVVERKGQAPRPPCHPIQPFQNAIISTSDNHERDRTIEFNQLGHLKAHSDARIRYFSSSSWVAIVEDTGVSLPQTGSGIGPSPDASELPIFPCPRDAASKEFPTLLVGEIDSILQLREIDEFIHWYSQYCQFWYPIVDISETVTALQNLRNCRSSPPGSAAVIAAICYSAACSVDASSGIKSLSGPPSSWKNLANRLLSASGYPFQSNLNTIRAAFLLAAPSIAEGRPQPDPGPTSVLLRAAQSLGLHREPLSFQLSAREVDFRRVLWWSIHGLDVSYSVAHALPLLIHPTSFDVQMLVDDGKLERRLLKTLIRISQLLSKIFEKIYGVCRPTYSDIEQLDEEAARICADEITKPHPPETTTLERFIAISQRMACCKMVFILHQPYLKSTQWPQSSRQKALNACRDYISDFSSGIADHTLAPYRWVLNHFDVIHACAIVLQDLIQHPNSTISAGLGTLVETCFLTFSKELHPNWARLEALRAKAWATNQWPQDEQQEDVVGLPGIDANLSDWDPLFASFVWDNVLI